MIEKDQEITKVIFKKDFNKWIQKWEVEAFFPDLPANLGNILCYAHIGQHSEASLDYFYGLPHAKPEEYQNLKEELESIGYNLKVYKKIIRRK